MSNAKILAPGLAVLLTVLLPIAEGSLLPNAIVEDFIEVPDLELELEFDESPDLDYALTSSRVNATTGDFEAIQNLDVIESEEMVLEPKRASLRGSLDARRGNTQVSQRILWGDEAYSYNYYGSWATAVEVFANETVLQPMTEEQFNAAFAACPVVRYTRDGKVHSVYKRLTRPQSILLAHPLWVDDVSIFGAMSLFLNDKSIQADSAEQAKIMCRANGGRLPVMAELCPDDVFGGSWLSAGQLLTVQSGTAPIIAADGSVSFITGSPTAACQVDQSAPQSLSSVLCVPLGQAFEPAKAFVQHWPSTDNINGEDFKIYPSLPSLVADTDAFEACDYDGAPGQGYPRNCGATELTAKEFFVLPNPLLLTGVAIGAKLDIHTQEDCPIREPMPAWQDNPSATIGEQVYSTAGANACPFGYAPISTAAACSTAADSRGFTDAGQVEVADKPKGCFYTETIGEFAFNTHAFGSGSIEAKVLCERSLPPTELELCEDDDEWIRFITLALFEEELGCSAAHCDDNELGVYFSIFCPLACNFPGEAFCYTTTTTTTRKPIIGSIFRVEYTPRADSARGAHLAEFAFLHDGKAVAVTPTVEADGTGSHPEGEEPEFLVDGLSDTVWRDWNLLPLIFTFSADVEVDAVELTTGAGNADEDPTDFSVSIGHHSFPGTWDVILQVSDGLPDTRQTPARFDLGHHASCLGDCCDDDIGIRWFMAAQGVTSINSCSELTDQCDNADIGVHVTDFCKIQCGVAVCAEPVYMGGWMRGEIQLQVSDSGLTLIAVMLDDVVSGIQDVLKSLIGLDVHVSLQEVELSGGRLLTALEDMSDSFRGSSQHLTLLRQWVAKREKLVRKARVSNLTAEQSGRLEMLNAKLDSISAKLQAWREKSASSVNRVIALPLSTLNFSESVRRLGWEEDILDPNYCPWHEGNTCCDNLLECMDGTTCDGEKSGWGCCAEQGSRKKCPPNYPHMCNDMSCGGGTSHCCGAYNCDASGGPRECGGTTKAPPPKAPGDECIWSNDGMCDEPMWCEEGTDTTDCLNNPGGGFSWGSYGYGGYGGFGGYGGYGGYGGWGYYGYGGFGGWGSYGGYGGSYGGWGYGGSYGGSYGGWGYYGSYGGWGSYGGSYGGWGSYGGYGGGSYGGWTYYGGDSYGGWGSYGGDSYGGGWGGYGGYSYYSGGGAGVGDSCSWANDGACDEPEYCEEGTDCTDCENCESGIPTPSTPLLLDGDAACAEGECDGCLDLDDNFCFSRGVIADAGGCHSDGHHWCNWVSTAPIINLHSDANIRIFYRLDVPSETSWNSVRDTIEAEVVNNLGPLAKELNAAVASPLLTTDFVLQAVAASPPTTDFEQFTTTNAVVLVLSVGCASSACECSSSCSVDAVDGGVMGMLNTDGARAWCYLEESAECEDTMNEGGTFLGRRFSFDACNPCDSGPATATVAPTVPEESETETETEDAPEASSPCQDDSGYRDLYGKTCLDYAVEKYCTSKGNAGSGWPPYRQWPAHSTNTIDEFIGTTADEACCDCGKDHVADESDGLFSDIDGWKDASVDQRDCETYKRQRLCNRTSQDEDWLGEGWKPYWDGKRLEIHASEDGFTAREACVFCGGGSQSGTTSNLRIPKPPLEQFSVPADVVGLWRCSTRMLEVAEDINRDGKFEIKDSLGCKSQHVSGSPEKTVYAHLLPGQESTAGKTRVKLAVVNEVMNAWMEDVDPSTSEAQMQFDRCLSCTDEAGAECKIYWLLGNQKDCGLNDTGIKPWEACCACGGGLVLAPVDPKLKTTPISKSIKGWFDMSVPIKNEETTLNIWIANARDENKVFKKLLRKFVLSMIVDSHLKEGILLETVNVKLKASDSTTAIMEVIRVEYEIVAGHPDPAFDKVYEIWTSLSSFQSGGIEAANRLLEEQSMKNQLKDTLDLYKVGNLFEDARTVADFSIVSLGFPYLVEKDNLARLAKEEDFVPPDSFGLEAGDVAVVAFHASKDDNAGFWVSLMALKRLDGNVTISFTDAGWRPEEGFYEGEPGFVTYKAPAAGLDAGEVFTWDEMRSEAWCSSAERFDLSVCGMFTLVGGSHFHLDDQDQISVFSGTWTSPSLIYAVSYGSGFKKRDEIAAGGTDKDSILERTLKPANASVGIITDVHSDYKYTGVRQGHRQALLELIHDVENWVHMGADDIYSADPIKLKFTLEETPQAVVEDKKEIHESDTVQTNLQIQRETVVTVRGSIEMDFGNEVDVSAMRDNADLKDSIKASLIHVMPAAAEILPEMIELIFEAIGGRRLSEAQTGGVEVSYTIKVPQDKFSLGDGEDPEAFMKNQTKYLAEQTDTFNTKLVEELESRPEAAATYGEVSATVTAPIVEKQIVEIDTRTSKKGIGATDEGKAVSTKTSDDLQVEKKEEADGGETTETEGVPIVPIAIGGGVAGLGLLFGVFAGIRRMSSKKQKNAQMNGKSDEDDNFEGNEDLEGNPEEAGNPEAGKISSGAKKKQPMEGDDEEVEEAPEKPSKKASAKGKSSATSDNGKDDSKDVKKSVKNSKKSTASVLSNTPSNKKKGKDEAEEGVIDGDDTEVQEFTGRGGGPVLCGLTCGSPRSEGSSWGCITRVPTNAEVILPADKEAEL